MLGDGLAGWLSWGLSGVTLVALVATIVLFRRRIGRLEASLSRLMSDSSGASLEEVLYEHVDRVRRGVAVAEEARAEVRALLPQVRSSFQHRALVRFDAYGDVGGEQSLALALADARGDGVLLTCLHGREGSRVYGKPLAGWSSEYHLSDEERQAVARARQEPEEA